MQQEFWKRNVQEDQKIRRGSQEQMDFINCVFEDLKSRQGEAEYDVFKKLVREVDFVNIICFGVFNQ